ncbi:hypothetical protein BYT27DRAFT_6661810 [Phlegmacium glaucopus]|nr:hypothetical protein BYT27DRAFT_6661810 [Phlegmacium glaucopus]
MSWTRTTKYWLSGALRIERATTRPVLQRQFSSQGSPVSRSSTQHSFRVLLFTSLTAGLVGFTVAKSLPSPLSPTTHGHESESTQFGSSDDFKKAIQELQSTFPVNDKVSTDPDDLQVHGFSANDHHSGINHSVVVYPDNTEDVVKIVKIANKYKMPIIPYAGATSLEGHFRGHPVGSLCVDMKNMDQIIAINESDSDLVCQPGVTWMEINETLKDKGIPLFFPIDPGPGATIGGMISTGCSGTNAVRYGTAKGEWFLNVTVVLPSGEVIKTRRRSRKSSAGFDTTKLFIGAEGTLGIITEATIRLAPVLPTTVAVVQFPNVQKATEAVVDVMNKGVGIQCVELVDNIFMTAINKFGMSERKWPEKDSLFFKFQGPSATSLYETAEVVKRIVEKHGGTGFQLARDDKEANGFWSDRKYAPYYAGLALPEGSQGWPTDVCVPVSKLPELVYETKKDVENSGLVSPIIGHVGDGNFHALIFFKTDEEKVKVKELVHRMVKRAIALDGTCTGEHGVGIGKREYLVEELGEGTVQFMRTIKKAVDPLGLFNPGKLYPDVSKPTNK